MVRQATLREAVLTKKTKKTEKVQRRFEKEINQWLCGGPEVE